MQNELKVLLESVLLDLGASGVSFDIQISDDPKRGEYSSNAALKASGVLKTPPMDVALQVKEKILEQISRSSHEGEDLNINKKDQNISKKNGKKDNKYLLQAIERIEIVSPGFINFFLTEASLSTQIHKVLDNKEAYGTAKIKKARRIVVEFTDPNPFKEFHIGHLYSNSVGESLCRLLESQGNRVRRVNYQGDVGMHVAKALYGLLKMPAIEKELESRTKDPLADRANFLGKAYASGAAAFENDERAASEMKALNKLIFIAAQQYWSKEKGRTSVIDYRGGETIDEALLKKVAGIYETGRKWSLEYFETIYARLGTKFEGYYFESFVGERGAQMVSAHVNDGVFETSDGAIVYRGEKKGLHTRVFINTLGLPTYEAKELGLAPEKYDDWAYDWSIIATGNEINEYFKVLLAALSEIEPELAAKTKHLGHGMVRKSDGTKMSSRSGSVLTGEGLLDEIKESIYNILDKNKSNYEKEAYEDIAEKASVAAVKYSLLRVALPADVAFDIDSSVSFDGDSGPYLLYTYARAKSVLRKSAGQAKEFQDADLNPEEHNLTRLIYFFPEIVSQAAAGLSPNVLCTYLFKLAQAFNLFYQKHTILESDRKDFRLALTAATAQVLKNGLNLLGISTVERM